MRAQKHTPCPTTDRRYTYLLSYTLACLERLRFVHESIQRARACVRRSTSFRPLPPRPPPKRTENTTVRDDRSVLVYFFLFFIFSWICLLTELRTADKKYWTHGARAVYGLRDTKMDITFFPARNRMAILLVPAKICFFTNCNSSRTPCNVRVPYVSSDFFSLRFCIRLRTLYVEQNRKITHASICFAKKRSIIFST